MHLEDLAFMKDTELSKSSNQVLDITFISTQLKKKKKKPPELHTVFLKLKICLFVSHGSALWCKDII